MPQIKKDGDGNNLPIVLASTYWTPWGSKVYQDHPDYVPNPHDSRYYRHIGAVLVYDKLGKEVKGYIGTLNGSNEAADIAWITASGAKLTESQMLGIFPNVYTNTLEGELNEKYNDDP